MERDLIQVENIIKKIEDRKKEVRKKAWGEFDLDYFYDDCIRIVKEERKISRMRYD